MENSKGCAELIASEWTVLPFVQAQGIMLSQSLSELSTLCIDLAHTPTHLHYTPLSLSFYSSYPLTSRFRLLAVPSLITHVIPSQALTAQC